MRGDDMRREHPLWRGFFLAAVLSAGMILLGAVDETAALRLDRQGLALCMGAAVGAGIASLPGRLRRRRERSVTLPSWRQCLRAFAGGGLLALALGLTGDGRVVAALAQGSTGAFVFFAACAAAGFATVRLMERRKRA